MSRSLVGSLLVVVLVIQGCAAPTRRLEAVARQEQPAEQIVRDRDDCEAEARRVSGYSGTGRAGFWARAAVGYTIVLVAIVGPVAAVVLGGARGPEQPRSEDRGDLGRSLGHWVGSEPRVEDYVARYRACMTARGYEVVSPEP